MSDCSQTVQSLKHSSRFVDVERRLRKPCWAEHNILFRDKWFSILLVIIFLIILLGNGLLFMGLGVFILIACTYCTCVCIIYCILCSIRLVAGVRLVMEKTRHNRPWSMLITEFATGTTMHGIRFLAAPTKFLSRRFSCLHNFCETFLCYTQKCLVTN